MADDKTFWLLHFDDSEIGHEIYLGEKTARHRFEQASVTWNCTLFVEEKALAAARMKSWHRGRGDSVNMVLQLRGLHPLDCVCSRCQTMDQLVVHLRAMAPPREHQLQDLGGKS